MRSYQICTRCAMDTSDPEITFDEKGICNHCRNYLKYIAQSVHPELFNSTIAKLKKGKCVIGMSGGVDSSYVSLLLKQSGIEPHVVTFNNGYNTKLAGDNIKALRRYCGWAIDEYIMSFKEFASMQLAYLRSGVLNIEALSDHAIYAVLWNTASHIGAKYIVSGSNYATEGILPKAWGHNGADLGNIAAILKANGLPQLPSSYPTLPVKTWAEYRKTIEEVDLLNYTSYTVQNAKRALEDIGWVDYGAKHCESVITRFYQRHILPARARVDKRRAHLSCLIMNGEMTRAEALAELGKPFYTPEQFKEDRDFVACYLDISTNELESLINQPVKHYAEFRAAGAPIKTSSLFHKVQVVIKNPKYAIRYLGNKFLESRWNELLILCNWLISGKKGKQPLVERHLHGSSTRVDTFWGRHTVITPQLSMMRAAKQDEEFIQWRAQKYPLFHELMGLWGNHAGEVVLDYGCGPGTDLVGFLLYSNADKVIGIDVSEKALRFARRRMALHNFKPDKINLIRISDSEPKIPLADNSVDFIYSQGVLHHTSYPESILKELCRVLKPGKQASIMVYNRQSVWFHLYVAYFEMITLNRFQGLSAEQAFAKTTDSVDCPISRCYNPDEFVRICEAAGFKAEYKGGYYSTLELETFAKCKDAALADKRLAEEHRLFLSELDNAPLPKRHGKVAGIGGVYILTKEV